jgi:hypothetical protein
MVRPTLPDAVFGACRASYARALKASIETCFQLWPRFESSASGIGLAAGFVFAAGRGTIRFVD